MATATDPNRKFGPDGVKIMKIGRMRTYFGPLKNRPRGHAEKKITLLLDKTISN